MKICNKWNFALGLCGVCITLCGILFRQDDWFRLLLFGGISLYFLFISCSKERSQRDRETNRKYKKAAKLLYGRYYFAKLYLPLILVTAVFLFAALFQSYTHFLLSSWAPAVFLADFLAAAAWMLVLDHKIKAYLESHPEFESDGP